MKKILINDLPNKIISNNAYFFCCSSFESRCLSIPSSLSNLHFDHAFIFKTQENLGNTLINTEKLRSFFKKNNHEICDISTNDPILSFNCFCTVFEKISLSDIKKHIYIDISTFTRESILILLRVLYKYRDHVEKTTFLYTPSLEMDSWLTHGVMEFRSILGFAGMFTPKNNIHLIILTGFELERAIATIEEYEPNIISIGVGDVNQSISPEFYERNLSFFHELKNIHGSMVNDFSFSLLDPISCQKSIKNQIMKFPESNVIISPLSNKISTLGAGFVGLENKNVQLCYAKPAEYNIDNYSTPDDKCIIIEFSLNNTSAM